jgi:hypothetical protein
MLSAYRQFEEVISVVTTGIVLRLLERGTSAYLHCSPGVVESTFGETWLFE